MTTHASIPVMVTQPEPWQLIVGAAGTRLHDESLVRACERLLGHQTAEDRGKNKNPPPVSPMHPLAVYFSPLTVSLPARAGFHSV